MTHDIKEGMYVRFENRLIQLKNVERGTIGYFIRLAGCIRVCVSYKDTYEEVIFQYKQVASTPMELIEIGDLVSFGDSGLVEIIDDTLSKVMLDNHSHKIIKILTPNTNGGFDLQWESEKE